MIHLRSVKVPSRPDEGYPFTVPAILGVGTLEFESEVTFLVGENGSGKSTLLEAIGLAAKLPIVGAANASQDKSLAPLRALASALKMTWAPRNRRGFFFRAEDFFRFAQSINDAVEEMEQLKAEYAERFKDRPTAYGLTVGSMAAQADQMRDRYSGDLHARSHGESFMQFFTARIVPDGLYLMDEPEASLSPQRQMALLSLIRETVDQRGGQFVIATHAPILMAYPGAAILDLDESPPQLAAFDDIEHVRLTRAFLDNPETFLRRL